MSITIHELAYTSDPRPPGRRTEWLAACTCGWSTTGDTEDSAYRSLRINHLLANESEEIVLLRRAHAALEDARLIRDIELWFARRGLSIY